MNRIAAGGLIFAAVVLLSVRDLLQPQQDVKAADVERPPPPAPKLKSSLMMGPTLKFFYW